MRGKMNPIHEHDCDRCYYLGAHGQFDCYWCPCGGLPTIVLRYGSYGGDYASGLQCGKDYYDQIHIRKELPPHNHGPEPYAFAWAYGEALRCGFHTGREKPDVTKLSSGQMYAVESYQGLLRFMLAVDFREVHPLSSADRVALRDLVEVVKSQESDFADSTFLSHVVRYINRKENE